MNAPACTREDFRGLGAQQPTLTAPLCDRCRLAPPLRWRGFSREFAMPCCGAALNENVSPWTRGDLRGVLVVDNPAPTPALRPLSLCATPPMEGFSRE